GSISALDRIAAVQRHVCGASGLSGIYRLSKNGRPILRGSGALDNDVYSKCRKDRKVFVRSRHSRVLPRHLEYPRGSSAASLKSSNGGSWCHILDECRGSIEPSVRSLTIMDSVDDPVPGSHCRRSAALL